MVKELFELANKCAKRAKAQVHTKNLQFGKENPESLKNRGRRINLVISAKVQTRL